MSVVLMICYARSGGTLLNKCLGVMPETLVLSEVNAYGGGAYSHESAKVQAKKWYGIDLKAEDFTACIVELHEHCESSGLKLIIREWTLINFSKFSNDIPDLVTNKLNTLDEISRELRVIPFAFVRDAIDVWISRRMPDIEEFSAQYLKYINELKRNKIKIFKYEDFCLNPELEMNSICEYCGIEFDPGFIKKYGNFSKVYGDIGRKGGSRGIKQNEIKRLPRKKIIKKKIEEIHFCENIRLANELLGYPAGYYSVRIERGSFFELAKYQLISSYLNFRLK